VNRFILLVIVVLLFVGSIVAVVAGFRVSDSKPEDITRVSYRLNADFDHQAYGRPLMLDGEPDLTYYRNIIDSLTVDFSYEFRTESPGIKVTEDVEISALLKSRGGWQKELVLVPLAKKEGNFVISFPLDISELWSTANRIYDEIGIRGGDIDLELQAVVNTVADVEGQLIEEDFIQTCELDLDQTTLGWNRDLTKSRKIYSNGSIFEHRGEFRYAISYKQNILYGRTTVYSPVSQPPVKLDFNEGYQADRIDTMDMTFRYYLETQESIDQLVFDVEVTAELIIPGKWNGTFVLVPVSGKEGRSYDVTFPVDVDLYYDILDAVEQETGDAGSTAELRITANVDMTAQSEYGPISNEFSPQVTVLLEPGILRFLEAADTEKSGALTETVVSTNHLSLAAKLGTLSVFGLMAIALYATVSSYREARSGRMTFVEKEALQAKRKHKDTMSDVSEFLIIGTENMITYTESLEELFIIADALLKPVLHKAERDKHTYRVVDGLMIYQYVSEEPIISDNSEESDEGEISS
jgi:hypothetical protein